MRRGQLGAALLLAALLARPPTARAELGSDLERATVRVLAVRGIGGAEVRGDRTGARRWIAVVDAGHGSGVVVSTSGLVLTARHVVEGADLLTVMLAGEDTPRAARVVYRHPSADIAFLHVDGPFDVALALPRDGAARLTAGTPVLASGFPLDVEERNPAIASGELSRVNNDGRIQLSMGLNPGNSGGPVATRDGSLLGVATMASDPRAGAQGIGIMEPIDRAVAVFENDLRHRAPSTFDEDDRRLAETVRDALLEPVVLDFAALGRLGAIATRLRRPEPALLYAAYLWNLAVERLESAGAIAASALPPQDQAEFARLGEVVVALARRAAELDPIVRARYPFSTGLFAAVGGAEGRGQHVVAGSQPGPAGLCGGLGDPCCGGTTCRDGAACAAGVCRAPHEDASEGRGAGALSLEACGITDTDPRASSVDVGAVGLRVAVRAVETRGDVRFVGLLGMGTLVGAWRGYAVFTIDVSVAARVESRVLYGEVAYAPTMSIAEARITLSPLGYRAEVGVLFGGVGIGVRYGEAGRAGNETLRTLGVVAEFGLGGES